MLSTPGATVHAMRTLEFWFDYISHNAYLAWCVIQPLAKKHELQLVCQPVLFAGLLDHYGGKGPAEVPAKNQWMLRNVLRKAAREGIPIQPPANHPFNPLLALRSTLAIENPEHRAAMVDALFRATWAESRPMNDAATLARSAAACGLNPEELARAANSPEIKDALHLQTRAAIRQSIFGVPSLRIDDELFWGYDDLPFLELYLSGADPLPRQELERWQRISPSARRRSG